MIRGLDHINIVTHDLEATRAFFVDVLGLIEGARPPLSFPGHWFYAGSHPIVHIQHAYVDVGPSSASSLNHAAFSVGDVDGILARLDAAKAVYRMQIIPGTSRRQIFIEDPNGVRLELNESASPD